LNVPRSLSKPHTVLYTLPDGQQVVTLLRTALFRELLADPRYRWVFLSPLADQPDFRRQFDHGRAQVRLLPRVFPSLLDRQIEYVRRELIHLRLDSASTRILHRRMRACEPKRWLVHRPLARLLHRLPGVDDWLYAVQDRMAADRYLEALLDETDADAVVLGSGAVKITDVPVARWARRRGLPMYGIIPSWDNLAIKGPTVRSDRLAVWNETMAAQAERTFGYAADQVAVTGPPQFDAYVGGRPSTSRRQFIEGMGLDPQRRLITFTTMPPFNSNFSAVFVKQLADWIAKDAFPYPCQLLVRLHPQDDPALYRNCCDLPNVRFDSPGRFRGDVPAHRAIFHFDPTDADMARLRDTLGHSDVVLNIASTITLEAVALDRPVVNLAYNPPGSRWPVSIGQYYELAHYRPVTRSGAVRLARSAADLLGAIDEALRHPERRRAERAALYRAIVGRADGGAAARLASDLLAFLGRRLGAGPSRGNEHEAIARQRCA